MDSRSKELTELELVDTNGISPRIRALALRTDPTTTQVWTLGRP
jgi:hypothetical protein